MKNNEWVIVNSVGDKLSSFYPNEADKKRYLVYRDNAWMSFATAAEAKKKINYIRRYGVGRNLRAANPSRGIIMKK